MMRKDGESRTVRLVSMTHDQLFTIVLNDVLNQHRNFLKRGHA